MTDKEHAGKISLNDPSSNGHHVEEDSIGRVEMFGDSFTNAITYSGIFTAVLRNAFQKVIHFETEKSWGVPSLPPSIESDILVMSLGSSFAMYSFVDLTEMDRRRPRCLFWWSLEFRRQPLEGHRKGRYDSTSRLCEMLERTGEELDGCRM